MERKTSLRWKLMVVAPLCLVALMLSSCSDKQDCTYTEFSRFDVDYPAGYIESNKTSHIDYSFEYPQCYNLVGIGDEWGIRGVANTYFTRPYDEQWGFRPYKSNIRVQVFEAGWRDNTDAKAVIDNEIIGAESDEYIEDFTIRERTSVAVAGISAEYLVYSYRDVPPEIGEYAPFFPHFPYQTGDMREFRC